MKLTDYSVMFTASATTAADKIAWTSDAIAIDGGAVKPTAKGVYALTATAGSTTRTIYLVVKAQDEAEYVLYEETFDNVSSFEELGYRLIQQTNANCTAQVKNGYCPFSEEALASNLPVLIRT